MIKTLKTFVFIFILTIISGCSVITDESTQKDTPILIKQIGIVNQSENTLFSGEYTLIAENGEILSSLSSNTIELEDFLTKKVIINGEIKESSSEKTSPTSINVLQIEKIDLFLTKNTKLKALGVEIPLDETFSIEEKNNRAVILKEENNTKEKFMLINSVDDFRTQNSFKENGEKIELGSNSVLRIIRGESHEIFYEGKNIMITFQGESKDLHSFYTIIEKVSFFTPEAEKNTNEVEVVEVSQNPIAPKASSDLISYIQKNIETIVDSKSEVILDSITMYEENILDIVYSEHDEKKRNIVSYTKNNKDWIFATEAQYIPGETQSWDLIEGETPILSGSAEVFLSTLEEKTPIILPEKFGLYVSTHYNFQIGYPRQMYYKGKGKSEENLAEIVWAYSPPTDTNIAIQMEILDGGIEKKRESLQNTEILVPRDERTHFKIFATDTQNWETLQKMAQTLRTQ